MPSDGLHACWPSGRTASSRSPGHAADARPILAAVGWFIPIGNLWVPWSQLRRSLVIRFKSAGLGWWQGLWIVGSVTLNISLRSFNDSNPFRTAGDVSNSLRYQSIGILVGTTLAAAACLTMRVMRGLEDDANTRR